jgi:hypothetical protein
MRRSLRDDGEEAAEGVSGDGKKHEDVDEMGQFALARMVRYSKMILDVSVFPAPLSPLITMD